MEEFIDSLGFRSLEKVYKSVKEKFPDANKSDVKKYLESLGADAKGSVSQKKLIPKMGKSISYYPGGWQMDLFIYKRKYYLLAINMNSRYGYVSDVIKSKSTENVFPEINKFVEKFKPVSISCDNEAAFTSKETVDYLISKNIDLRVITEQVHSSLGIINRFCRTLRDMMENNEATVKECVKIYNNTYHRMIGMKPTTMFHDAELEEIYISRYIFENELKIRDFRKEIKKGMKVRYILDYNKNNKKRYKLSPKYYVVDSIDNFKAVIYASDGSVKTVPLYRIVKLKPSEKNVEFAETFENTSRGIIEDILDYNPINKSATVRFKIPDGSFETQTIPIRYLREQFPTRVSDLEMNFLDKNKDKYTLKGRYLEYLKQ